MTPTILRRVLTTTAKQMALGLISGIVCGVLAYAVMRYIALPGILKPMNYLTHSLQHK